MEESTNYGDFNPNKTLASIETQIQAEATWIKNWQEMYGDLLIDPETIALSTDNTHLKRLFETTKLNTRNTDHWKFLLSMVIETVYRKGRAGRPKKRHLDKEAQFLLDIANELRANNHISTAKALAEKLIKEKYKTFGSVQSLQNKISTIRKRAQEELCSAPFSFSKLHSSSARRRQRSPVELVTAPRRGRGVNSLHHCERGQARGYLHLHVDRACLDPLKGYGRNPLNHACPRDAIEGSGEPEGMSRTLREHKAAPQFSFPAAIAAMFAAVVRASSIPVSRAMRRLVGGV